MTYIYRCCTHTHLFHALAQDFSCNMHNLGSSTRALLLVRYSFFFVVYYGYERKGNSRSCKFCIECWDFAHEKNRKWKCWRQTLAVVAVMVLDASFGLKTLQFGQGPLFFSLWIAGAENKLCLPPSVVLLSNKGIELKPCLKIESFRKNTSVATDLFSSLFFFLI